MTAGDAAHLQATALSGTVVVPYINKQTCRQGKPSAHRDEAVWRHLVHVRHDILAAGLEVSDERRLV